MKGTVTCDTCRFEFPLAWFKTRGAVREGNFFFCSIRCKDAFREESEELFVGSEPFKGVSVNVP